LHSRAVRTPVRAETRLISPSAPGHCYCLFPAAKEGLTMLWILAMLMAGLGLKYVTVRRKRKADHKAV
jgi:hypothetical protein